MSNGESNALWHVQPYLVGLIDPFALWSYIHKILPGNELLGQGRMRVDKMPHLELHCGLQPSELSPDSILRLQA